MLKLFIAAITVIILLQGCTNKPRFIECTKNSCTGFIASTSTDTETTGLTHNWSVELTPYDSFRSCIEYFVDDTADVAIFLYDVEGELIDTLFNNRLFPGLYETCVKVEEPGVYTIGLHINDYLTCEKMIILY